MAKIILKKKIKAGGITLSDFKLYYKAVVIKTAWCLHKISNIDQWSMLESPESNPHICGQLIFKEPSINNGKNIISSINSVGKTGQPYSKKKKLDHYLTSYTKINIILKIN